MYTITIICKVFNSQHSERTKNKKEKDSKMLQARLKLLLYMQEP